MAIAPLAIGQLVNGSQPRNRASYFPMPMMSFGEVMRRYRGQRKLTQEALAKLARTDAATINQLEKDPERVPGHDVALRIIRALGAPPEPFLLALGYPIGEMQKELWPMIERLIMESDRSEDEQRGILAMLRLLFEQDVKARASASH